MQYYVLVNSQQKEQLENLEKFHDEIVQNRTDDFKDLIIGLVKYIRENKPELIKKSYLNQIFISANKIVYSFNKFKEAKNDPLFNVDEKGNIVDSNKESDIEEEAMVLVFFSNAKAFLELINRYTKFKPDNELFKDIVLIRNYLAHFHDKKIEQREFFINLSIERGLREYSVLNVFDMNSGFLVYEINFSLELFYFSLRDIFEKLKNNPELF